jgi:hypothetical protein
MGEILGIGTTHYPPGLVPEEHKPWPLARMLHTDPRIPEQMRNPASWPEPMRAEWGEDEGIASFRAHRERVFSAFRAISQEIAVFRPDFILMWGDDQYENFRESIVPPFCVLAYDTLAFGRSSGSAAGPTSGASRRTSSSRGRGNPRRGGSSRVGCSRPSSTWPTPTSRSTATAWPTPSPTRCSTSTSIVAASTIRCCR